MHVYIEIKAFRECYVPGLVAGQQDTLALLLVQAVGRLADSAFAAIHAFPITGELPTPALHR